ncbi:hypothetical protein [Tengunoibacter tsumagoiensis]|uniref:Uncharacterized protein n=1 Tax=Tengunoibacter tsumagoiensis TaxID=2014871 RepID=A0A401ZZQ6_9CHLR|nr:hypothetical protein [Tengunoibacter tsumagoiensis]GCE12360.1 hypothetical protein KTT_22190 [Tengunoibacter tsumagoiensis]
MKFIKAIYTFIVGDIIILVGVLVAILILTLLHTVAALEPLRPAEGVILILTIVLVLVATLVREAYSAKRYQ